MQCGAGIMDIKYYVWRGHIINCSFQSQHSSQEDIYAWLYLQVYFSNSYFPRNCFACEFVFQEKYLNSLISGFNEHTVMSQTKSRSPERIKRTQKRKLYIEADSPPPHKKIIRNKDKKGESLFARSHRFYFIEVISSNFKTYVGGGFFFFWELNIFLFFFFL